MKEYTITQTYELVVTVTVHAPEDMSVVDIEEMFTDLPISVTVDPDWDETDFEGVVCEPDISVDGVHPSPLVPTIRHNGQLL
jgi:hypothetical protein